MENSNNTGKMLGALLVGAVIGGVIGVLFAPDKGSETRKRLLTKGEDLSDTLKNKFNSFVDNSERVYEDTKQKVKDTAEHVSKSNNKA
jgi:gas vesicle protein